MNILEKSGYNKQQSKLESQLEDEVERKFF